MSDTSCDEDEFRCTDSSWCISESKRCDGYKDCRNGEDEPINCDREPCVPDHFTCKNGNCAQKNWICDGHDDCGDSSDESDCPTKRSKFTPELVVGSRDGLHRIDLLNTSWVKHRKLKEIVSLDFGSDPSLIYWSDRNTINLLDLHNGDTKEIRFHHDGVKLLVENLAVDGPANKLYWADSVQGAIFVGDLRNRRNVKLIKKNLDSPRAIVVGKGYIYWVDCCRTPKIERSRLDGAEREKLFSNRKKIPNGLALDESGGKLYWAGTDVNEYGIIGVITLSDLSSKVIFQRTGYLPYGLDVFEGYAYWTDQKKEAVLRINNNNSVTEEKIIFPDLNKPNGMKIRARREKRPGGTCNQNNGGCEHLCFNLVRPSEQKCLCEEGFRLRGDGKTCEILSQGITNNNLKSASGIPFSAIAFVIAVVLVAVAFAVLYCVVKKCLSHFRPRDEQNAPRAIGDEHLEDTDATQIPVVDPATENTDLEHPDSPDGQLNNENESSEINQQVLSVHPAGACAASHHLSPQVAGSVELHVTAGIVNFTNTLNVDQVTYNMDQVNLQQSGGTAVFGDYANVNNFSQPPQNC